MRDLLGSGSGIPDRAAAACVALALGLLAACGPTVVPPAADVASLAPDDAVADGTDGTGTDAAVVVDAAYPAIRPPRPVAQSQGGPILSSPQIFTVTFGDDALASQLGDFDDGVTLTSWWTAVASEYCDPSDPHTCIGRGHSVGRTSLPMVATRITDDGIHALIQSHVADGSFPAPTEQSLYVLYFPVETTVVNGQGVASCVGFHAYHGFASVAPMGTSAPVRATYAVIARCADSNTIETQTYLGSHEILEAATDPFLDGYQLSDPAWVATHGGELADVCLYAGGTSIGEWSVERGYSSARAAAGDEPCVPVVPGPSFNAAPADGNTTLTLDIGGHATLHLVGFSDAPVPGGWTVHLVDSSGEATPNLTFAPASFAIDNGVAVDVTVTLVRAPTAQFANAAPFMIRSTMAGSAAQPFWPGVVLARSP